MAGAPHLYEPFFPKKFMGLCGKLGQIALSFSCVLPVTLDKRLNVLKYELGYKKSPYIIQLYSAEIVQLQPNSN